MTQPDVLKPLKTWSHLAGRRRKPSEYEIVSTNLHYSTDNPDAPFELDPNFAMALWFKQHRNASPLKHPDWDAFRDPDEMVYRTYNLQQDGQETYVQGLFEQFSARGHDVAQRGIGDPKVVPGRRPGHGLSRRRLSLTVAGALALLTLAMVVNGETLAPWGQRQADALKASAKSNDMIVARYSGLWAREGEVILNAGGGDERDNGSDRWLELRDVSLYEFEPDGRLKSMAVAKVAEHRPGGWLLRDVTRTTFGERSVARKQVAEERWESRLDTTALTAGMSKPRYMAAPELKGAIEYRLRNGLDAGDFQEIYWGRWFYALNALALCLAAIPFAFGSLRSGGLGKRLFVGIVFALGFWLLQTQFVRLAQVYRFDFRVAYLLPTVIMVAVSVVLFRRRSG